MFIAKGGASEDKVMDTALEAGAEDVIDDGDSWQILSSPTDFITVKQSLEQAGWGIESGQIAQIPGNTIRCGGDVARKVINLLEALDDHEDVQKVHANFDIPEEEMAGLQ